MHVQNNQENSKEIQESIGLPRYSFNNALKHAVSTNHIDIVKILLYYNADVNKADDGSTALMVAAENGNADLVKYLLDNGADVNAKTKTWTNEDYNALMNGSYTALMYAAKRGHTDVVKILLASHADVNVKVHDKNSNKAVDALSLAEEGKYTDIVQLLKQMGADTMEKDR